MKLSEHFSFEELTNTSHTSLLTKNRHEAQQYLTNLSNLALLILEPLRVSLGKPITISSGFRGEALNKTVGGSKTSQHSYGEAADIQVDGIDVEVLFHFIKDNCEELFKDNLGQCIKEVVNGKSWVHLSLKTVRYKEILKERYGNTESVFLTTVDGKSYQKV